MGRPTRRAAAGRRNPAAATLDRAEIERLYALSGYDLDHHPAHLIRRAHQRATLCFAEIMGEDDLTPTQFAALATVLRHGELSQNRLGRLTAMDPSTISLVVRKLLKLRLIRRTRSKADLRLALITLTEAGTRYTLDRLRRSVEVGQRVLAPLSPDEQARLIGLLRRICAADEPDETLAETAEARLTAVD